MLIMWSKGNASRLYLRLPLVYLQVIYGWRLVSRCYWKMEEEEAILKKQVGL